MRNNIYLVTGSNGFLGSAIVEQLNGQKKHVRAVVRNIDKKKHNSSREIVEVGEINDKTDWKEVLNGVNVIIHSAARNHVMNEGSLTALDDYREVNTNGTMNLAKQAVEANVKRFIYISSIKVNGESTQCNMPFTKFDAKKPEDLYAKSKAEAEDKLLEYAKETGLEVVIVRPPLIYGPGVKGNFASLLNLISKGYPLPFSAITLNKRSLVSLKNAVDFIVTCSEHPKAANETFLISDNNDLSTYEIVNKMSVSLGKKTKTLYIPLFFYYFFGKVFSKENVVNRLLGSLQVDISHSKEILNWQPVQTVEDAFNEMGEEFLKTKKKSK